MSRWTYDNEGRMTSTIDPLGGVSTYEYDKLGRQISMTNALGRSSRSVYNEKGELIESIAPDSTPNDLSDNPRMRMVYDAAGRKITEIDVLGRETRYVYDKVGRLLSCFIVDIARRRIITHIIRRQICRNHCNLPSQRIGRSSGTMR